jgi:hypothetical protein
LGREKVMKGKVRKEKGQGERDKEGNALKRHKVS